MDKPRDHTPVADYLEHGAFTVAAIAADPEVAGLEKALEGKHDELKKNVRAHEDTVEQSIKKRAVFMVADAACDRVVRACELAIYGLVNKRRDDPLYRRYFKNGLRAVTEAEPRKAEPALVKDIVKAMGEDAAKPAIGPIAQQFAPQLQAAVAVVEAAEKDLAAVEAEEVYLREKTIAELKTAWVDEYVKLHAALKMAFPRDPERVESYFLRFRKDRKKSDDAEPITPSPGGTP